MKKIALLVIVLVSLSLFVPESYPFWIWKPKESKWLSPSSDVKPTPKGQLKYAKNFHQQSKYKEAIEELRKLLKYYPKSFEASEAQFYLGLALEAQGYLYEAFKEYQKVIDKYPFSQRIDEVIEQEFSIGRAFMEGEKRKVLGLKLPLENPAIEIFAKVIENSPYGKYASESQYNLALVLKNSQRYQEARLEFEKLLTTYPDSVLVAKAKFQAADCASKIAPDIEYGRELTREAKDKFEEFTESYSGTKLKNEAEAKIKALKEKEAEGDLRVAEFYEKQKKYSAARIYYRKVLDGCPSCLGAVKAGNKLKELDLKKSF